MIVPNSTNFSIAYKAPVQASALGNNANIAHTPGSEKQASERRLNRYRLQDEARRLLPGERVANCLRRLANGKQSVKLLYYSDTHAAGFSGLQTCGSVWVCPVCASKITQRRRDELAPALDNWLAKGGGLLMASFTLRHDRSDKLAGLRSILAAALRQLTHERGYISLKKRFGILEYIAANEITWSEAGGWHPHRHYAYILERELADEDIQVLQDELTVLFLRILAKFGRSALDGVAIKITAAAGGAGEYLAKWGFADELTRQPVKRARAGFSPFQLLADSASGSETSARSGFLFQEYASAMHGAHQLQYSRGVRALLGLSKAAASDSELAKEDEPEALVLAEIDRETWHIILSRNLRVDLLKEAESGSALKVALWLSRLRSGVDPGGLSPGYC